MNPAPGPDPAATWREVATRTNGPDYAQRYARTFDDLAASGKDVHGEARFVAGLVPPGARVLDAGCGTGRVAARLAELGYEVVGVDVDAAMVDVARERHPELTWQVADLADLDLARTFDLVVSAGNVIPFIPVPSLPSVARSIARHLGPGGLVVCGFGLAPAHLPQGAPIVPLTAYDEAWSGAGLEPVARYAGWDSEPYAGGGYAVSVHRRS